MMLHHVEIINDGEDPREIFYEEENYENLLRKLFDYNEFIPQEKFRELEGLLKLQMMD